jgi:hypothetical protein
MPSIPANKLDPYTKEWAAAQFGPRHAAAIADILTKYTRYNGRRKPELLSPETYSLLNYQEAEKVVADYNRLAATADSIYRKIPEEYRDAYYQLVLYPVKACANLNEMVVTAAKNKLYAAQGRASSNILADRVKALFAEDSAMSHYYNKIMAGGKWDHMMDQTHIGYRYWQEPKLNKMPDLSTVFLHDPFTDHPAGDSAAVGIAIEGSASWWPKAKDSGISAILPVFDPYGQPCHYFEIFTRTNKPAAYKISTGEPWLHIASGDRSSEQTRLWVTVDWANAPSGMHRIPITISSPGVEPIIITAIIDKPAPGPYQPGTFIEGDGVISMEAAHYTRAVETASIKWLNIPDLGRTLSGMEASPVAAPAQVPGGNSPRLEYRFFLFDTGALHIHAYFSPTLDFAGTGQLRYAISLDDEPPQIMNLAEGAAGRGVWDKWVSDNIIVRTSVHHPGRKGVHTLKYWLVDPAVVLQKIVVDAGGEKPSYLGPPESHR